MNLFYTRSTSLVRTTPWQRLFAGTLVATMALSLLVVNSEAALASVENDPTAVETIIEAPTTAPTSAPIVESAEAEEIIPPVQSSATAAGTDINSEIAAPENDLGAKMGHGLAGTVAKARGTAMHAAPELPGGVLGQDVSGWQADPNTQHSVSLVNWAQQWSLGSRFVYAKATEGNAFIDRSRTSHITGARSVGMLSGTYHFALPGEGTAKSQADHFVNNGGTWVNDGKTLPPILDIENNPYADPKKNPYLGNNCYNFSPASLVTWIKDFSAQVQNRTGRLPVIYTNYYWWQECTGNSKLFANQPLHIAAYGASKPWIPSGWSDYAFWQFSDSGPFAGDSNVWNGTVATLKAFAANSGGPVTSPSIVTKADVIAVDGTGALWNYPATGTGKLSDRVQIGVGWQGAKSLHVVDWNNDGVLDLVAQWKTGTLNVYLGLTTGGFQAPLALGNGWSEEQMIVGMWDSSSPYPQILSRTPQGTLEWWRNRSGAGILQGTQIGQGWGGLQLSLIDMDGDGRQDVAAVNAAGELAIYRSDGKGKFVDENRRRFATGWQAARSISVVHGFSGADSSGFIVNDTSGNLNYVPSLGNSTIGLGQKIGFGWTAFRVAGGEEISWPPAPPKPSIKSASDIVVVDKAGTLWRHANNGAKVGTAEKIGVGFGTMKSFHILDWNADGTLDLLAQTNAGSLNYFAGLPGGGFAASRMLASTGWADADISTGQWVKATKYPSIIAQRPDGSLTSYTTTDGLTLSAGQSIGHGFWDMHPVLADYDGDGNADVGIIDGQGRFITYRSNGKGSFLPENRQIIGVGWQGMTSISPAGKFTSPNSAGVLARNASGSVFYYPVSALRFAAPVQLASGWGESLISGSSALSKQPIYPLKANDVVSADSAGTLWRSRATGTGNFADGEKLGHGWVSVKALHVVDWNADGIADVITQWLNGKVSIHYGTTAGGLGSTLTLASYGWEKVSFVTGQWLSRSKYPVLVGTNAAGNLFYWPNMSGGALGSAVQIGHGWGGLKISMIDFDKNGSEDLLAVDASGYMRLYQGTGTGGFVAQNRPVVGQGWGSVKQFSTIRGYMGTSSAGLMTVTGTNRPRYYPLSRPATWGTPLEASVTFKGGVISR